METHTKTASAILGRAVAALVVLTLTGSLFAQVQFTRITAGPQVTDNNNTYGVALVDYDSDGDVDIFCGNGSPQENCLYRNIGNWQFRKITEGPLVNDISDSGPGLWADIENDGDLDVYVVNYSPDDGLYLNQGDGTFARSEWPDENERGQRPPGQMSIGMATWTCGSATSETRMR